jgi:capsular polysaccharide export protein
LGDWPQELAGIIDAHGITDIVLYGDTRPIHAQAVAQARAAGLHSHIFEEGYLRPYWVSYERGGANGHSRLMEMSVAQMRAELDSAEGDLPDAPAVWGDMRQHVFYGMAYHFWVLLKNQKYRHFQPHRALTVTQEFRLYLRRLALMPISAIERRIATRAVKRGGFPYHLCLLQLEHDASFKDHSPFDKMEAFLELVIEGFAKGAPDHHHLVLKAHPLEDGRAPLRRNIRRISKAHGVATRVHYLRGGKLAYLLATARSAVTVNSTAAQQALWRGLPLRAFGQAVYNKPEFVSDQPLAEFFADPQRPDAQAYRDYRRYLLATSQVTGGFYSARGRRALLRQVTDRMLAPHDPYDSLRQRTATQQQQLRVVE